MSVYLSHLPSRYTSHMTNTNNNHPFEYKIKEMKTKINPNLFPFAISFHSISCLLSLSLSLYSLNGTFTCPYFLLFFSLSVISNSRMFISITPPLKYLPLLFSPPIWTFGFHPSITLYALPFSFYLLSLPSLPTLPTLVSLSTYLSIYPH